jgi:hypothetical protein
LAESGLMSHVLVEDVQGSAFADVGADQSCLFVVIEEDEFSVLE